MTVCQNLVPLVNIKIAGKWMFIPLKMVLIGIDPYPNRKTNGLGYPYFMKPPCLKPPAHQELICPMLLMQRPHGNWPGNTQFIADHMKWQHGGFQKWGDHQNGSNWMVYNGTS